MVERAELDVLIAPEMVDEVHLKVLRALQERPDVSQRELAELLGVSLGKANYCIRALVEKGFVKIGNFRRSTNKLGYAYVLTPSGIDAKARLARAFLAKKIAEYDALKVEILRLKQELDLPRHDAVNNS